MECEVDDILVGILDLRSVGREYEFGEGVELFKIVINFELILKVFVFDLNFL